MKLIGYTRSIDYEYSIETIANDLTTIYINFQFFKSLAGPKLFVDFMLSSSFIKNYPSDIIISNNQLLLKDITILTESEKVLNKGSQSLTEATRLVVVMGVMISNALAKSFAAVQTLMLMNLILYLKYMDINFPSGIQSLYDTADFALPIFVFNYNNPNQVILPPPPLVSPEYYEDIVKDEEDLFLKYGIYLYFLDNYGDKLLQFCIVYCVAFAVLRLEKLFSHSKILKILGMLKKTLCWGWLLDFFVTNYRNILICIFRLWKYCVFSTTFSKIDLIISIIVFIFIHIGFFYLLRINREIARIERQKDPSKRMMKFPRLELLKNRRESEFISSQANPNPYNAVETSFNPPQTAKDSTLIQKDKLCSEVETSGIRQQRVSIMSADDSPKGKNLFDDRRRSHFSKPKEEDGLNPNAEPVEKKEEEPDEFTLKYGNLISDYKRKRVRTNSYAIFFLARFTCYSFLIVFMKNNPFFQILFMEYVNIMFILYMLIIKPFESTMKLVFSLIIEVYVVFLLAIPLYLVYLDQQAGLFEDEKNALGQLFLTAYYYFTIVIIALITLGIIKTSYDNRKKKKEEKKKAEEKKKMEEQRNKSPEIKEDEQIEDANKLSENKEEGKIMENSE